MITRGEREISHGGNGVNGGLFGAVQFVTTSKDDAQGDQVHVGDLIGIAEASDRAVLSSLSHPTEKRLPHPPRKLPLAVH